MFPAFRVTYVCGVECKVRPNLCTAFQSTGTKKQNIQKQVNESVHIDSFCSFASVQHHSGFEIKQDVSEVQTLSFNPRGLTKVLH